MADTSILAKLSDKNPTFTHLSIEDNEEFKKLYHLRERTEEQHKRMVELFETALTLRDEKFNVDNLNFRGTLAHSIANGEYDPRKPREEAEF